MNVQRSFPNSVFLQAGVLIAGSMFLCVVRNAYADHPPLLRKLIRSANRKRQGMSAWRTCTEATSMGRVPRTGTAATVLSSFVAPPPPPEAFDACSGKKESDECTVTFGSDAVKGTCRTMPDGRVACAPPHHGGNE